jgi:hypothetical protein
MIEIVANLLNIYSHFTGVREGRKSLGSGIGEVKVHPRSGVAGVQDRLLSLSIDEGPFPEGQPRY